MNIPTHNFKIKISPFVIDVVYQKLSKISGKDNYGSFDFRKLQIIISKKYNLNPQQLENSVIHEVLHAIWEINGVKDVSGDAHDAGVEEAFVERITAGLQSFIVDNPKLFK
jgi:uncharacterized alkaline shock family protein YloU